MVNNYRIPTDVKKISRIINQRGYHLSCSPILDPHSTLVFDRSSTPLEEELIYWERFAQFQQRLKIKIKGRSSYSFSSQHDSSLFEKLPLEVRIIIYEILCGKRPIHINFYFHRVAWYARGATNQFKWMHWTCIRWHENRPEESQPLNKNSAVVITRQKRQHESQLGIMGWVTSCRQAYLETIDFIYSSNSFHMRMEAATFCRIPTLILRQHLASIKVLQCSLLFERWASRPCRYLVDPFTGNLQMEDVVNVLCKHFTGLTSLVICTDIPSLEGMHEPVGSHLPSRVDALSTFLLEPMDKLVKKMKFTSTGSKSCVIFLERNLKEIIVLLGEGQKQPLKNQPPAYVSHDFDRRIKTNDGEFGYMVRVSENVAWDRLPLELRCDML